MSKQFREMFLWNEIFMEKVDLQAPTHTLCHVRSMISPMVQHECKCPYED